MKTARIADQIAQVDLDLAELDEQVEAGELDEATAERLRSGYRSERAALEKELDEVPRDDGEAGEDDATVVVGTPSGKRPSRAVVGTVIVAVAAVIVAVIAMSSLQEKTPAGEMTDGVATDVLEGQGNVDMGSISLEEMEAAVAQTPETVGMRIALADRYAEAGDYPNALEHYVVVLGVEPTNSTALDHAVQVAFLMGEPGRAESLIVQAVSSDPGFLPGYWLLANVRYEMGDMEGVVEPLEKLLAHEDIPPDIKADVEAMLEEARS